VGSRIRDSFREFSKILTILPLILELSWVHESDSFREFFLNIINFTTYIRIIVGSRIRDAFREFFQNIIYFTIDIKIIMGSQIRDSFREFFQNINYFTTDIRIIMGSQIRDSFREFSKILTILTLILELSWVHKSGINLENFPKY